MKKTLLVIVLLSLRPCINASSILPDYPAVRNEAIIPLPGTKKLITVEEYLNLSPRAVKELTGKKMNMVQRIDFALSKHFLKRMMRKDGSLDAFQMRGRGFLGNWQWHWGGFALGLFLSLLGPIIALFFNDDYKWDRFWTALHTALWVWAILLIIALVAA
jgi:hypothetical protein